LKWPDSTVYYVYMAAWPSGRAAGWHAAGGGIEPRCEHTIFRISTIVYTVAKYSCAHHGTDVDVYLYDFCFKIKELWPCGYA
jgi:hypothetical protein